jgi:hypothetical protein
MHGLRFIADEMASLGYNFDAGAVELFCLMARYVLCV